MDENKKIKRRQGERCKINEVKSEIIMYILESDVAVSGSEIRRHLYKKFGIMNSKNIKNHLEKLTRDHCIEKFPLVGDDFGNKWDIILTLNLMRIDLLFPQIPQNEYNKCLSLLQFEEIGICLGCLNTEKLRVLAKVSRRFYDVCLKGDFKNAYNQTKEYLQFTEEGHEAEHYLNKSIDNFYEKYIMEFKFSPEIKILKDDFKEALENRLYIWDDEEPELVMNKQLNDNYYDLHFFHKMVESSTSKMLEENSTIKKNISVEVLKEISDNIPERIVKVLLENQSEELDNYIREIKTRLKINCTSSYYLFFKSCVLQDFQNSMESSSEKYFLQYLEKFLATISIIRKRDLVCYDKEFGEFIKEHDNIYSSFYKSYFDQKEQKVVI